MTFFLFSLFLFICFFFKDRITEIEKGEMLERGREKHREGKRKRVAGDFLFSYFLFFLRIE